MRNILVIAQITISMMIIIASLTINRQLQYMKEQNTMEGTQQILVVHYAEALGNKQTAFKQALLKNQAVQGVSFTNGPPGSVLGRSSHRLTDTLTGKRYWFTTILGDYDLPKILGLNIVEGRGFSDHPGVEPQEVLINQKAAEAIEVENTLNRTIKGRLWEPSGKDTYQIIGIFENFHHGSLRSNIEKMIIYPGNKHPDLLYFALIQAKPGSKKQAVKALREEWRRYTKGHPIKYSPLVQNINKLYDKEQRTYKVFKIFALLSVLIASLGWYGIALFILKNREKEMGIRKTLGASMNGIRYHLSRQFLTWLISATLIAWPLAYILLKIWLQGFAHFTSPHPIDFFSSLIIVAGTAFGIITHQILKISKVNPAETLKVE